MPAPANLVHETTTVTGTGNATLSSVNGKRRFSAAFGTGATTDVFDYFISNRDAAEWERGTGHMSDANTLVRDTVIESSNANAAVNFSAGTKDVANDAPAAHQGPNPQLTTVELGHASDTTVSRSEAGRIAVEGVPLNPEIPVTDKSEAYTLVLADQNRAVRHPASDNNARTYTIPANSSVAYPVGTFLTFINEINTITIAIATDTLVLAGAGTTGSRTLAANGIATAIKVASTRWYISGTALT